MATRLTLGVGFVRAGVRVIVLAGSGSRPADVSVRWTDPPAHRARNLDDEVAVAGEMLRLISDHWGTDRGGHSGET
jgi:hypothetical protein